jgi:hypothetical protein
VLFSNAKLVFQRSCLCLLPSFLPSFLLAAQSHDMHVLRHLPHCCIPKALTLYCTQPSNSKHIDRSHDQTRSVWHVRTAGCYCNRTGSTGSNYQNAGSPVRFSGLQRTVVKTLKSCQRGIVDSAWSGFSISNPNLP